MNEEILAGIRASIVDDAAIVANLGVYADGPAIFTRVPVPDDIDPDAVYPMIVIPPAVAVSDGDGLGASRPILVRDLMAYGIQPGHFRKVESLGYMLREKFHRQRHSITVDGYHVISVTAQGPVPAPVDDDMQVGRRTTLTIQLEPDT